MFQNYLKIAYRNLVRHKIYSLINISGLAIGIAFCVLAFLFVRNEWTYDAFHENADRIYRVYQDGYPIGLSSGVPDVVGPMLSEAFPNARFVRINRRRGLVQHGDQEIRELFHCADPAILEVFSFPLVKGDPATALKDPHHVVITETMAQKYFPEEDPIGKTLSVKINQSPLLRDLTVAGVIGPIPQNSSIRFEFLYPFEATGAVWGMLGGFVSIYMLLPDYLSPSEVERQFADLLKAWPENRYVRQLKLQPLREVHLGSERYGLRSRSNPVYSYILAGIAMLVLAVACVNYTTLAVGRSFSRAREVGIRKVVGGLRTELARQFLSESVLLTVISLALGLALAEMLMPGFNSLTGKDFSLSGEADVTTLSFLLGLTLFVGIVAGSYPAFVMSGILPVEALKGRSRVGRMNLVSRTLVVFQVAIATFLVAGTLMMTRQLDYLRTKPLGIEVEEVVVVNLFGLIQESQERTDLAKTFKAYQEAVLAHHAVLNATRTPHTLRNGTRAPAEVSWEGATLKSIELFACDLHFLETLGIPLISGRRFERDSDKKTSVIVNEALGKKWGWQAPLGKTLRVGKGRYAQDLTVIGVVRDFHFRSLHHPVEPAVLQLFPEPFPGGHLMIRIRPEDVPGTLRFLKEKWQEMLPDKPFRLSFLDEEVDRQYREEERWFRIVRYATLFAVFIACLGAFGLTALAVSRRTKEVGIRKALGASVSSIVSLFVREFVLLVAVATVIAWPVAYYAVDRWLQDFAYRIELGISTFVLAGVLMLAVVLATVSLQTVKAARANPVDALRYE